jgi:hypothetical protein
LSLAKLVFNKEKNRMSGQKKPFEPSFTLPTLLDMKAAQEKSIAEKKKLQDLAGTAPAQPGKVD